MYCAKCGEKDAKVVFHLCSQCALDKLSEKCYNKPNLVCGQTIQLAQEIKKRLLAHKEDDNRDNIAYLDSIIQIGATTDEN